MSRPVIIRRMWPLALLALFGLLLDLLIHVAATLGFNPQDWLRPEWLALTLYYTLFAVVVGSVLLLQYRKTGSINPPPNQPNDRPLWFRFLLALVTIYAVLLAADLLFQPTGGTLSHPSPNVYVADPGHGRAPDRISQQQYDAFRRDSVRLGSGIFLVFYLQATHDLFRAARNQK